jgi:hypothetical protein
MTLIVGFVRMDSGGKSAAIARHRRWRVPCRYGRVLSAIGAPDDRRREEV